MMMMLKKKKKKKKKRERFEKQNGGLGLKCSKGITPKAGS